MDGTHSRRPHPVHPPQKVNADDDYRAASKGVEEAVDYKQYMPALKPEHKLIRRMIKTVVLLIVVAGFGTAAYVFGSHYNASKSTASVKATTTSSVSKVTPPTEMYSSTNQNLTFVYPTDWKVQETSTIIAATSPTMKLTNYTRSLVTGRVLFQIRAPGVALSEFSAGAATAVLNSQIIDYATPASGQRASTYISFLNYASSKGTGIDGVYVSGNTGYQTGQTAPESDIQAVDPVVSVTFEQCTNKTCSSTKPLTIATKSWSTKDFSNPLLAMIESLSIS
jgi:hypothetical protein